MKVQTFRTICDDCGEEVISQTVNMTGNESIIIDFLEDMQFVCGCGATTYLSVEKYTR